MKPLTTFLFLLSFFFAECLYGQNLPSFRHYNIKGLPPKSVISCIYQDKEGFLWFSGLTGLYRYDGNTLTGFQHNANDSTSLPHNYIVDFCEDTAGNLVCGSLGGGLFVINKSTGKVVRPQQANQLPEAGKGSIISSITPSIFSTTVWCGSSLGALIKYDAATKQFERIFSIPVQAGSSQKTAIPTVLEIAPDKLLVASYHGLYFLDASTRKGSPIGSMNTKLKRFDSLAIYSLMLDKANQVWIGYEGGVMIIDKENFDPVETLVQKVNQDLSSVAVTAITQLKDGQVLFGTNNGILCWTGWNNMIKKIASEDSRFDHSPKSINDFYTDRAGNIWVATEAQGLFLLNKNYSFFKTIPGLKQLMGSNKLQAILEDQAFNWWIGGENGLVRYSPKTNRVEVVPLEDNGPVIYSIFEDDKKGIWVGTAGSGVFYIADPQKPNVKQHFKQIMSDGQPDIIDFIMSISQDRFGNIWLGSFQSGVFIHKPGENNFLHYSDINNPPGDRKRAAVSQIIRDNQGAMWVSTLSNGINKFIPDPGENVKGKFINYTNNPADSNSLSFGITTGMKQDKSGNLWVSTVSGGLNKFDPEKKLFRRFSMENGLPSNLVYHIEEDKKGNIWFSTDEGLCMLSQGSSQVINFKEEDGLPTRSFTFLSSCTMRDGTVAFGTIDGDVVYFQPEEMEKNNLLPTIVDFKLFNRTLAAGENAVFKRAVYLADTFHLQYDQSVFTFEFSNLDLINPESYTFAYKLEGVDKDWNYISNRKSATYTNLSSGKYVFRLRAANHLGIWSDREISKLIIVSPPWWRTWWAYTLYLLVFAGGLWAFIRYRSLSLLREKKRLAQQVTIRTAEVVRQKEEIAVQRDNLEQAIHDLKSTQAQLIQSEKMASLGELTAGIAHEIQNPLNFVNNFSEVNKELVDELQQELKAGKIDEAVAISNDIKENEEKINHHGKRADAIVKGMLQHSRSSSGVKEPTDINALADEYLRLAYHGLRAKDKSFNANFRTDFDEDIGKISIIPQDIGRVILNLLTNAFYSVNEKNATSAGGQYEPMVTVSTRKINNKFELKVQDNGAGIPQKALDKIFQPFFTTKPTGQGTGLGLSMSYDIVTKGHGGELKVETKEGAGTTFIILLPINS